MEKKASRPSSVPPKAGVGDIKKGASFEFDICPNCRGWRVHIHDGIHGFGMTLTEAICICISVYVTGKMSWGHITPVRMVGRLD